MIECQRSELLARQHLIGFEVFLDGLVDDVLGQVVVAVRIGLKPVANELLIEGGLAVACLIAFQRPEAGGIGGQHLVAQNDIAVLVQTELKLGVGDDDAAGEGILSALLVQSDGVVTQLGGVLLTLAGEQLFQHVDALLVINNERLRQIYPELAVLDAFGKADDTLSIAAKSIAEIITVHGLINLDFNDVKTVLKDGGVAIMSTGYGEGEGRVKKAIEDALNSPLLNDNDVFNSKKILLSIAFSSERKDNTGLTMDEMNDVNDFMGNFGDDFELKWGLAIDPELGNKVKVTVLATGFGIEDVDGMNVHLRKHTEEETRRIAEQEEKRAEREDRRKHYYGSDGNTPQYKRHPHIFLFRPEDLDNEDVIMQVEDTPTYKRTRQMLEDIRHIASGQQEATKKEEGDEPVKGVISFA